MGLQEKKENAKNGGSSSKELLRLEKEGSAIARSARESSLLFFGKDSSVHLSKAAPSDGKLTTAAVPASQVSTSGMFIRMVVVAASQTRKIQAMMNVIRKVLMIMIVQEMTISGKTLHQMTHQRSAEMVQLELSTRAQRSNLKLLRCFESHSNRY
ncbi:unnamed protein product [Linum tenue]|uniref:Uncharacterized protein n=1 Tax=Linum tenue TaxID=586396 RepID=A0AAV0NZX0_9ROSI|nr:unnamed protein product [Linum tenue]